MGEKEVETPSDSAQEDSISNEKTRREFIKLAGLGAGAVVAAKLLPGLSDSAGGDRVGVLGKPQPPPPSDTTNPLVHNVEVVIYPTAASPTKPFSEFSTLQITTPIDPAYAKPAVSIYNGTTPSTPVTTVDKNGNIWARTLKTESSTPALITLDAKMASGQTDSSWQASTTSPYIYASGLKIADNAGNWKMAMDKEGNLTARAVQSVNYTPYFSSLQEALDRKGVVFHPTVSRDIAGSTPLLLREYTTLVGGNYKQSRLNFTDTGGTVSAPLNGIEVTPPADLQLYSVIRELSLTSTTNRIGHAIKVPTMARICLEHLLIADWGFNGMEINGSPYGTLYGKISDCEITNCNYGMTIHTTANVWGLYRNWIHGIHGARSGNYGAGIAIASAVSIGLYGTTIEGNYQAGITIAGGRNCIVDGSYFEAMDSGVCVDNNSNGCTVRGTYGYKVNYGLLIGAPDVEPGHPSGCTNATVYDNSFQGTNNVWIRGNVTGLRAWNNRAANINTSDIETNNVPWTFVSISGEPAWVEATWGGTNGPTQSTVVRGVDVRTGGSSAVRVKDTSGAPDDGTFGTVVGSTVWNSAENKFYVRGSTGWKSVLLG